MRKPGKYIALLTACLFPLFGHTQTPDADRFIESILESHLNKLDPGTDVALIIEDLERFLEYPVNINSTNEAELSKLYILNDVQIHKLLKYVDEFGPALSIYELNTIDGFTPDVLKKLQYLTWFGPTTEVSKSLKEEIKDGQHQLLLRALGNLQKARGYKPKEDGTIPYEGNRFRYYTRYNFEIRNKLSAGITAEKDPGEAFFKGSNKHGFDFYSGHISYRLNNTFEKISVGDYLIRAGQGLVIWQGYTTGKSENVLGILKTGQGVRPYTSVDENYYFRGGAGTIKLGRNKLSLFASYNKIDGNLAFNDSTGNYFTSAQTTGYHRTQSEIEDEKSVGYSNYGGIFTHQLNNFKIGATFIYQKFDKPLIRSDKLYNFFRFSGRENYTFGIDYLFNKGRYQLFGEAALSKSKGKAFTQGAIIHLNDQLSFAALYRNFEKDYHAFWANTFAEGSNIRNESGMYIGTRFLPAKYIRISAYSDLYQSDWISYSTAAPARSWDIFIQSDFKFSERFNFYLRFKNEEKELKFKSEKQYVNFPERIQKTRIHFQYQLRKNVLLKTRCEYVYYKAVDSEEGLLLFQDIQFMPERYPLKVSARLAYFSTRSYASRIYAYENDLLYTFSIPAYYGKGFRTYLNLKYKITPKLEAWMKFGNTRWIDRKTISSGYNEISGKNKTELKFQLRLKF